MSALATVERWADRQAPGVRVVVATIALPVEQRGLA